MRTRAGSLLVALLFLSMTGSRAMAHRVVVYAWVEGGAVKVRANFGRRSRPAKGCPVEVRDGAGMLLLELRTNERGECSFRPPRRCALHIKVNAGEGHIAKCVLAVADLGGVLTGKSRDEAGVAPGEEKRAPSSGSGAAGGDGDGDGDISGQLSGIREALAGVQRRLAEVEQRRREEGRFQSVVNGLCALLGITGAATLTLYLVRRRKEKG